MNSNGALPNDLHLFPPWFPILRRLRMAAPKSGVAVVSFSVVVDSHGNPVKPYPSPKTRTLEPRDSAEEALMDLIDALVDGSGEE